ncbi:MAG: hypothetical protein IS860_08085 [Nitrosopumilus sp.]|nr:hypothetical protein [Nitrosopumilus sp.]
MRIEIEVAIITVIVLLGIVGVFYLIMYLPWDFYFECLQHGMIPYGTRSQHSCHQIQDYMTILFAEN